jgi:hypothetical protein
MGCSGDTVGALPDLVPARVEGESPKKAGKEESSSFLKKRTKKLLPLKGST